MDTLNMKIKTGEHEFEADAILKRHADAGFVVTTGKRKRRRYRLTKDGVEKAHAIASALAGSLPQEKR
jgi:DNA-binding PadR family transcriptional regulator